MHLGLGSLSIFFFWLWTQKCVSPLIAFASASAFILVFGSLFAVGFLIVRLASRPGGALQLFTKESSYAQRWGSLYKTLKDSRVSFLVPLLVSVVCRSAIIGFGQKSGLAQVAALIVLELVMCIGQCTSELMPSVT
jgi:Transient receptor potential (TRP) ion channel